MTKQLLSLSAGELAPLLHSKAISPVELTKAHLDAIEASNPTTHIYITVCPELAMAQARQAEKELQQGAIRGLLHGIPFSCKDLFHAKGIPTTGGSKVMQGCVSTKDAKVITRLYAAGAILLGKTNLHEFAYGATGENNYYGTVNNPYDAKRNAGGSSSGSAAAVASNLAVFSLGTDTAGSVRSPSALCGVVGLKPTYSKVSLQGVVPYCWSLDHFGVSTRSVHDANLVLDAVLGTDTKHSNQANKPLTGLRVGIPEQFFYDHAEPDIIASTRKVIDALQDAGCICGGVKPPNLEHSRTVSLLIQLPEMLSYHSRYFKDKNHLYGIDLLAGMAVGQFILAEHYVRAKRIAEQYRQQLNILFETVDVLLTPAVPITAPLVAETSVTTGTYTEAKGNAITRYASFFNLTGNPAMTVPTGFSSQGLPMGVQIVGRHDDEATLCTVGTAIEHIVNRATIKV